MKIFFVIKALHLAAGTERATINLANELALKKHDVGLISLVNEGEPFFTINKNVQVFYLHDNKDNRQGLVRDFSRRKKLKQLYKQEQPDIVIIVGSGRSILNIPAARGIKKITWEHFNVNVNWHLLHPLSRKLAAMFSDSIVTLTQQDAENFKQKFSAKKVICIPNPITIDNTIKSALTDKRVLAIGRITKQKGFDLLVDAWNQVENRKNGWKLRIIGNGPLLPQLKDKINSYQLDDSIELIASSSNVVEHYQQSSIYVMSSRYEGLPLVLIEAMAMGLPIVSFDCETGPRDIVEDMVTGFLVPPFDCTLLAQKLDELMGDTTIIQTFSANALHNVAKFETTKIVDKWESLLNEIVSK